LRILSIIAAIITGAVLIYGIQDIPKWGDPKSPASLHVSPRYVERTVEETAVPNVVTSVLADYRGYDTLGETTVIFTAGIACILILRKQKQKKEEDHAQSHSESV
jgi:multicomponent Na+:H+ antiporter subunit B